MKEFELTKWLGLLTGTLIIIGAFGFGFLSLIGTGLGKALGNSYIDYSPIHFIIFITLLLTGIVTLIGGVKLNQETWRHIFRVFCNVLGIVFIAGFVFSYGSIGFKIEIFILFIGIVYLLLSYMNKKKL